MSYIASEAVTLSTSTSINSYRSISGRSTLEIAMPADVDEYSSASVLGINTTGWKAVGAIDGTVSLETNTEITKIQSNQHLSPHAGFKSGYDFQLSFTLQEVDIHNWALALGHKENVVQSNSLDPNTGQNATELTNSFMEFGGADSNNVSMDADYRAIRLTTVAAGDYNNVPGSATAHQVLIFYKAMFQVSGSIDFDRSTAQSLPITAHCFGNNVDEIGCIITGVALTTRGYGS